MYRGPFLAREGKCALFFIFIYQPRSITDYAIYCLNAICMRNAPLRQGGWTNDHLYRYKSTLAGRPDRSAKTDEVPRHEQQPTH